MGVEQAGLDVDRHIGLRLRQRRLTDGMDEMRLAERLDVTLTQLRFFEKGLKRIPPAKLIAAAEAFKVSIGWFFEDAPAAAAHKPISGVNAEIVRFLSMPEAYPLISAFNALHKKEDRQSVVDAARGAALQSASDASVSAA